MKSGPALWLGRPIADEDDVHELEYRSSAIEFGKKVPRAEAEQLAHEEYSKDRRQSAAAHHLQGMKASLAAGQRDEAAKHGVMYEQHMKALSLDPHGPVPPEISSKLHAPDRKSLYRFKAHAGDVFALPEGEVKHSVGEDSSLTKAEKRESCDFTAKSTKERCKNPRSRKVGGRYLCHHHADLAAKEDHRGEREPAMEHTRFERMDTPTELVKADGGSSGSWESKDGLSIPKMGTAARRNWDRQFYQLSLEHHGGRGRLIEVNLEDTTPRNRAANSHRLDLYRTMARKERKLPPIVVQRHGSGWYVVDGNHRVEAAKVSGLRRLDAIDITEPDSYGGQEAARVAPSKPPPR